MSLLLDNCFICLCSIFNPKNIYINLSTFTVNNHNCLLCFQQPKAELAIETSDEDSWNKGMTK